MALTAYIDGACEPKNPGGTASYGVLLLEQHLVHYGSEPTDVEQVEEPVWECCGVVGSGPKMSNNVAEYAALIKLLEWLDEHLLEEKVEVLSDSQLVVNQMSGEWKTRVDKLYYPYFQRALLLYTLDKLGEQVRFKWIPREQNLADRLAVRALEEARIHRRLR